MITKADLAKGVDMEEVTRNVLDMHPHLWAELMEVRGETRKNVLVLLSGSSASVAPEHETSLPADILTLEPGQLIMEVSALDEHPSVRAVKVDGAAEWQMREYRAKHPLPRVIPRDEKTVLILDASEGAESGSQIRPEVEKWDGIDAA